MKNLYNGLEYFLTNIALDIIEDLPYEVKEVGIDLNVVYYPQLGYLICVPLGSDGQPLYSGTAAADDADDENRWDWMFGTDQSCYFKSDKMRALDDEIGDIFGLICGEL